MAIALPLFQKIPAALDVLLHAGYPALDARWQHAAFAGSSGSSARRSSVGSGSGYGATHDAHGGLLLSALLRHHIPSPRASSMHSVHALEGEAGGSGRTVNDSVATWGDDEVRGTQVCVWI